MLGITTSYSTGLPALDPREDFGRARRWGLTAQVGHRITGRLDSIGGTVEARTDFDAQVWPASNRTRRAGSGSRSRAAPAGRCGRSRHARRRPDGHDGIEGCHRVRCYLAERAR
jgi:hypothetical protein